MGIHADATHPAEFDPTDPISSLIICQSPIIPPKHTHTRLPPKHTHTHTRTAQTGKIPKTFSKADCEHAIVQLLCDGVLAQTYKNTAYSTNVYLVKGRRASHVVNGTLDIKISFARGDDSDSDDGDDTLD